MKIKKWEKVGLVLFYLFLVGGLLLGKRVWVQNASRRAIQSMPSFQIEKSPPPSVWIEPVFPFEKKPSSK